MWCSTHYPRTKMVFKQSVLCQSPRSISTVVVLLLRIIKSDIYSEFGLKGMLVNICKTI